MTKGGGLARIIQTQSTSMMMWNGRGFSVRRDRTVEDAFAQGCAKVGGIRARLAVSRGRVSNATLPKTLREVWPVRSEDWLLIKAWPKRERLRFRLADSGHGLRA